MAGDFNPRTGKFRPAFPVKSAALTKATRATTKNERLKALKRVADTNNRARPENSVMATHRDMAEHDTSLLEAIMLGNWAQTILRDISDKHKRANFLCFFPLLAKLKEQLDQEDAEGFWDDERARSWIVVETSNFSVETLKSALANFVSLGEAFFVSTDGATLSKAIHYAQEYFRLLIEQDTKTWLRDDLSVQDGLAFVDFCLGSFDKFLVGMAIAGEDFQTSNAVAEEKLDEVQAGQYEKALRNIEEDLEEIRTAIRRNKVNLPTFSY